MLGLFPSVGGGVGDVDDDVLVVFGLSLVAGWIFSILMGARCGCYVPDSRHTFCSWYSWETRNKAFARDEAYFEEYKRDKGGEGSERRCC